jgi:hypothetical protein
MLRLKKINVKRLINIALISSFIALSPQALAQKQAESAEQDMEVVTIKGQRSTEYFFREYERAKFAFYEAYNKVNTERQFSIDCRIVKPIGTRIAKRECLPRFFREESAYQAQLALLGASNQLATDMSQIAFLTRGKQDEFYNHIENLSKDSPELLAHLQNISSKLEALLERKHGNKD